ncbi:MAG: hypothetical protein CVV40_00395 [Planctomycetes bacterium HGW-Planctomycetes-2]|nr:MAG: hypothetical protein CVV40_00395 [Planctomycetes bacterium HGW-Planctomycetes-2]
MAFVRARDSQAENLAIVAGDRLCHSSSSAPPSRGGTLSIAFGGRLRTATLARPESPSGFPGVVNGSRPGGARLRQKAVRKIDPETKSSGPWRAPDGATLQLLAHEVVYLRGQLPELTDREREVAFAVCSGGSNNRIAERLCVALPTLRTHLMRLNQKLGAARKSDIVRIVASRLLDAYRCHQLSVPITDAATTQATAQA